MIYTLDDHRTPRPAWLDATERRIRAMPLTLWQARAALQLVRGLEALDLPEPSVGRSILRQRGVAGLLWTCGDRGVLARPFTLAGSFHAEISLWESGDPLWSGTRHAPVPMLRSALGWVYERGMA